MERPLWMCARAHLSLVAPLYLDEAVLAGVVQHEAVDFQLIALHFLPSQRHLLQLQTHRELSKHMDPRFLVLLNYLCIYI